MYKYPRTAGTWQTLKVSKQCCKEKCCGHWSYIQPRINFLNILKPTDWNFTTNALDFQHLKRQEHHQQEKNKTDKSTHGTLEMLSPLVKVVRPGMWPQESIFTANLNASDTSTPWTVLQEYYRILQASRVKYSNTATINTRQKTDSSFKEL